MSAAMAQNPQLATMLQQMLQGQGAPQQQLSPLAQALQSIPNFDQVRQLMSSNPQMLQTIIQQLRNTNPQLFNLINQYPQEFIQILQQGIPAAGEGAGGGDAGAARPGGPGVIQVTPEEKEAIDRLAALGFPEQVAAEAYLVCGKNEELAANFLFESGAMDFDDAAGGDAGGEPGN
jgi:UV excision repair protein RAD23